MVGLMVTSSKRRLCYRLCDPGLLHPEPLPLRQVTADLYLHRRHSNRSDSVSVESSGFWCAQVLFEPSESLWKVRGLILNMISPLPPSCWGFSFALGLGISFCGIQCSPVNGCSAVSCNFGVLPGEDKHMSFYSTNFGFLSCRANDPKTAEQ